MMAVWSNPWAASSTFRGASVGRPAGNWPGRIGPPHLAVNAPPNRKPRMGLVGGGQGSFIGKVHSIAACLDNRAVVVAGALSSDPARAKASAPDYDIAPDRAYGSYQVMIAAERKRPDGDRIDFVSVTTPNHTHYEVAKAA